MSRAFRRDASEYVAMIVGRKFPSICMKARSFAPPPRVDLHRPKKLIIQFRLLNLWKNASHTNFIYFCKMSLIEFQRSFIVVLVSKLVSFHKKKEKNGMKKMLIIQFPSMEVV